MAPSAEVRWFWPVSDRDLTARVAAWFDGLATFPPGGGDDRSDVYVDDSGLSDMGIKTRGAKPGVEIKAFLGTDGTVSTPAGPVPIELWRKWATAAVSMDAARTVETVKTRRLRKLDLGGATPVEVALGRDEMPLDPQRRLPAAGCNIEVTRVVVRDEVWITLGFEAFAASQEAAVDALRSALSTVALPDLGTALCASYPAWLRTVAARRG